MSNSLTLRHPVHLAWTATLVLAAVLTVLTLMPPPPQPSGAGNDKLYHFIGFGALALPLCLARPQRAWAVVAGVIAFGAVIELVQPYFGRGAEWADLLADALGAATAALLARTLRR